MPTPTLITDLSQTAASNYPQGSDSPATLDDTQRAHGGFIATLRDGKGFTNPVTIASATTTDIGGQNSQFVEVSGTTTITSLGTTYNGPRYLRFTGALVLTHNATTINLPGAANITTVAGDSCIAVPNIAVNGWNILAYSRAAGSDYLNTTRIDVASAATLDLATNAPNTRNINITGTTAITGVTVAIGQLYFVRFNAALILTNNASIVTQTGANIQTDAGATCILRAIAANTVEVLGYVLGTPSQNAVVVPQTVLLGPVDANGFSSFGGATGATTVTAAGTLTLTAANGIFNRIGTIANPSWTGLSTNGTMYLFLDIAASGTCTTGSTTLAPIYQWGGTRSTVSGQATFNIQEMSMTVGNGSTAVQTYRVFVGEVTVGAGVVSAITWYALMGRYESAYTATLPALNSVTSQNHRIGVPECDFVALCECTTIDVGFSVGANIVIPTGQQTGNYFSNTLETTRLTAALVISANYYLVDRGTFSAATLTRASWKYKFVVRRRW